MTRDEAIKKLKESKNLFDSGKISKEDFDASKKIYKKFLLDDNKKYSVEREIKPAKKTENRKLIFDAGADLKTIGWCLIIIILANIIGLILMYKGAIDASVRSRRSAGIVVNWYVDAIRYSLVVIDIIITIIIIKRFFDAGNSLIKYSKLKNE